MKQKTIMRYISTGTLAAVLSLVTSTVITQAEVVKGANHEISLSKGVNLEMIWISSGSFTMGSPSDEIGRGFRETEHKVTLTKGYWMGKYEVTQAQYEAIMGKNPSEFEGANLPVDRVDWDDAMEFCKKLTEKERKAGLLQEGYKYTLPTEAQWEYACRAGKTTALNIGKNLSDEDECHNLDNCGWYKGNSNEQTHPVGKKKPNAWGLYDMHGNVSEWCLDYEHSDTRESVKDPGPKKIKEIGDHVIRGGDWNSAARDCRSASWEETFSHFNNGFRIALVQDQ